MRKDYKYDDRFKRWARALQFAYREEVLNDFNENRAPQVLLSDDNARKGLIFYEGFRDLILSKDKVRKAGISALTNNMLRSEHIPYNIFAPLETMPETAAKIFEEIIDIPIDRIVGIEIEYAGRDEKELYLNDRTSFDTFVWYKTPDGKNGGIGIEVKYTENEYPLGDKERRDIEGANPRYRDITSKSGYYVPDLDVKRFLTDHHLRQIWRNHILGCSMMENGDVDIVHHVHIYPRGNEHFHLKALPEYRKLLSKKGDKSFKTITYEKYFSILDKHAENESVLHWVKYLRERYLGIKD